MSPARAKRLWNSRSCRPIRSVQHAEDPFDQLLSKHFPSGPAAWHRITIRQLLTHTSGLKDYEGDTDLDMRKDYDEDAL